MDLLSVAVVFDFLLESWGVRKKYLQILFVFQVEVHPYFTEILSHLIYSFAEEAVCKRVAYLQCDIVTVSQF